MIQKAKTGKEDQDTQKFGSLASRQFSHWTTYVGLFHKYDGIIVVGRAGQTKRCLTSCGVVPQSAQTLRLASLLILLS